jgi:hypothetical protein
MQKKNIIRNSFKRQGALFIIMILLLRAAPSWAARGERGPKPGEMQRRTESLAFSRTSHIDHFARCDFYAVFNASSQELGIFLKLHF